MVRHHFAMLAEDAEGNWPLCKRAGVWGVRERGGTFKTGTAQARRVAPGDRVFVFSAFRGGLIAALEVTTTFVAVADGALIPWPEPEAYAGSFGIRVLQERPKPAPDRWPTRSGRSQVFGIESIFRKHGFREITDSDTISRLAAKFTI